jgi:CMP-N-acetylneuraminic acid synthetase
MKKTILQKMYIPFITDEIGSHIDIDYEEDLKMAEIILNHYL